MDPQVIKRLKDAQAEAKQADEVFQAARRETRKAQKVEDAARQVLELRVNQVYTLMSVTIPGWDAD